MHPGKYSSNIIVENKAMNHSLAVTQHKEINHKSAWLPSFSKSNRMKHAVLSKLSSHILRVSKM